MSQTCPLCGKTKLREALFCDDCAHRIRADYEVGLPEEKPNEHEVNPVESASGYEVGLPEMDPVESASGYKVGLPEVDPVESESNFKKENVQVFSNNAPVNTAADDVPFTPTPKRKKNARAPLLFLLGILILGGAFIAYNEIVRKRNLERSGWETAVKLNSVGGYMAYMEAYPQGAHFDEAQEGLFRLKSEEAMMWERLKASDNTAELRDFLSQHPGAPYAPLVERRLDSLNWVGALRANTLESYSEYMIQSERDLLRGDYMAEARKRYDMLQSALIETVEPDSITVLESMRE